MENLKLNEEIRYCTSCGAANKKSAHTCEECKKEINKKHRPFFEFIKRRAKNWGIGELQGRLFDFTKGFIKSHLYGFVMTVSVVITGSVVITNATPYVKTVKESPFAVEAEAEAEAELPEEVLSWDNNFGMTEREMTYLRHMISAYDAEIDNKVRSPRGVYWSDDDEYNSPTEFFAENNIPGYTYSGAHEMYTSPINISVEMYDFDNGYVDYEPDDEPYGQRDWVESTIVHDENVTSALGKTLYEDGYDVMEIDYYMMTFRGIFHYDFKADPPLDKNPYELAIYRILLTKEMGEERWYIAEDRLIRREGV